LAEQTTWRSRPLANPVRRFGASSVLQRVGDASSAWHRRRSETTSAVPRGACRSTRDLRTLTFRSSTTRRGPSSIDRSSFCSRIFSRTV